jgi:uncharacterized protein YlzI (FlbEa/FlbD family)
MLIKVTNKFGDALVLNVNFIVEIGPCASEEGQATVYTVNGNEYNVKETVEEVYALYNS